MGPEHPPEHRLTPFYLNFGVVAFPRAAFDLVAPRYLTFRPQRDGTNARCRLLGAGGVDAGHGRRAGPHVGPPDAVQLPQRSRRRGNVPGRARASRDRPLPEDDRLDRHRLFTTPEEYAAFLELQLSGANRVFREAVTETFGTRYPFARGGVRQT